MTNLEVVACCETCNQFCPGVRDPGLLPPDRKNFEYDGWCINNDLVTIPVKKDSCCRNHNPEKRL